MNDTLRALSWYRMEQAKRCIRSAKVLADDEDYKGAANRSLICSLLGRQVK